MLHSLGYLTLQTTEALTVLAGRDRERGGRGGARARA